MATKAKKSLASPDPTRKARRGRPGLPPEQQRARLLDAAERCFEHAGYESVGVMDIVHEARMSTRSFYQCFEDKDDLVVALAEERAAVFLGQLERMADDADNALEATSRALRLYLEQLPVVLLELDRMGGAAGERVLDVRATYREKIGGLLLREMQRAAAGGLLDDIPNPTAVVLVLAGIEGLTIRYQAEGRREELVALHPHLMEALTWLFPRHLLESMKLPK